jgi:hypothetical protein
MRVAEHLIAKIIPVYVKMDISMMDRIQNAYVNKIFIQLFLYIH